MNIKKFFLFSITIFSLNAVTANPQGTTPPIAPAPAGVTAAPAAPHDDLFLEMGTEPKNEKEFLGEMVKDEKKIEEMAKQFDERLKKIETSVHGMCQAVQQEPALGASASTQPQPTPSAPVVPASANAGIMAPQPIPPVTPPPTTPKV